nr:hypothetical protein [Paraburkholderia sp. J41]
MQTSDEALARLIVGAMRNGVLHAEAARVDAIGRNALLDQQRLDGFRAALRKREIVRSGAEPVRIAAHFDMAEALRVQLRGNLANVGAAAGQHVGNVAAIERKERVRRKPHHLRDGLGRGRGNRRAARDLDPVARHPNVAAILPAVIAGLPRIAHARRGRGLINGRGRREHHDLRVGGRAAGEPCGSQDDAGRQTHGDAAAEEGVCHVVSYPCGLDLRAC